MATIKIYKGSFYMRNYYNNPRPQLSNMSFLFLCKFEFFLLEIKACRAYSRNLGQRSMLARKDTYEKAHFFDKGTPKIYPPHLSVCIKIKLCIIFAKGVSVECNIGLEYALVCLLLFSFYFYSPKYLF